MLKRATAFEFAILPPDLDAHISLSPHVLTSLLALWAGSCFAAATAVILAVRRLAMMQQALSASSPLQRKPARVLADEIGGRVSSTPAFEKAQQ